MFNLTTTRYSVQFLHFSRHCYEAAVLLVAHSKVSGCYQVHTVANREKRPLTVETSQLSLQNVLRPDTYYTWDPFGFACDVSSTGVG